MFVQEGTLTGVIEALQSGFTIHTGKEMVDDLFNRGGLDSMIYTVSMTIVAMTFGGTLEFSGMLQAMMNQLLNVVKSTKSLIISTIVACFMTNASCAEQYISIVVPSRMFSGSYRKMRLHSKNLPRSLEDGRTLTSVFIPWNTCGVFIFGTLGVSVVQYGPYAILNFVVPMLGMIYAMTGFTITKLTDEEKEALEQKELEALQGKEMVNS